MIVTREIIIEKLSMYLNQDISLAELVDWAESVMLEGDFDDKDYQVLRDVVSRIGVADVKAFGLTWEDFEDIFVRLGYRVRLEISPQP